MKKNNIVMVVFRDGSGKKVFEGLDISIEDAPSLLLDTGRKGTTIEKSELGNVLKGIDSISTVLRASHWLCEQQTKMCYRAVILKRWLEGGRSEITTHEQSFERGESRGELNDPEIANYYWGHYFNKTEIDEEVTKDFEKRVHDSVLSCYNYAKK